MYAQNYFLEKMEEEKKIKQELAMLEDEHRKLDEKIESHSHSNILEIQRMKKQKLGLKDQISRLYGMLHPDIIA